MWLEPWQFRKPITLSTIGEARFNLPYETGMKSDFGDIRFTDADGITELNFARMSYSSGVSASYCVEATNEQCYAYFGNDAATYSSAWLPDSVASIDHETGFAKVAHNPIIAPGATGAWDDHAIYGSAAIEENGITTIFYGGGRDTYPQNARLTLSVGRATSTDGQNFTKQGMVIDRATLPSGLGLAPFCVKKIGGIYYLFMTNLRTGVDYWLVVMQSTDLVNWTNFTRILGVNAAEHSPCVIDDPSDPDKLIMYYARMVNGIAEFQIARATALKSNPHAWTLTGTVLARPTGSMALYPDVRWNGHAFEMLYATGPFSGKYLTFKTMSRDGLTFPHSSLLVVGAGAAGEFDEGFATVASRHGNSLFYSGRDGDADLYAGIGLANAAPIGGLIGWGWASGNVVATSERSRSGAYCAKLTGGAEYPMLKDLARGTGKTYEVWIYDDLSNVSDFQNTFRLLDSADADTLVGIRSATSATKYIYRTKGGAWSVSPVTRSLGWHRLSFDVSDDVILRVDGIEVATDTAFDTNDFKVVAAYGRTAGVGYVDDYSVYEIGMMPVITRVGTEAFANFS